MSKRIRVVVTGASGFLGGVVVNRLTEAGFDCLGVSRTAVSGICQVASYRDAPAGDVLIHLAETNDRSVANARGASLEADAEQTLDALLAKGYCKVIYASSAVLYGDHWTTPRKISDPVEKVDTYTRIKLASEKAVLAAGGVVVRLANLYGPGMAASNVLNHIMKQLGGASTITMHALDPVRDFLWVDDAALALSETVSRDAAGLFNVGSGQGTSIRELVALAQSVVSSQQQVVALHKLDRLSYLVLDIAATRQALGWEPRIKLEQGVRNLLNMNMKPRIQCR